MVLNPQQTRFVREYLIDLNGKQAAIRSGYSAKTATQIASRLLSYVHVAKEIARLGAEYHHRLELSGERVLADLQAIAFADPRELVEHRHVNCRHCWGIDHRYQYSRMEWIDRIEGYEDDCQRALVLGNATPRPLRQDGGEGFDRTRDPNPDCPECRGDGKHEVFFKDTRKLSKAAARLYAGAKIDKGGKEMLLRNQDKAIESLGRHLKLFTDKVELTGKLTLEDLVAGSMTPTKEKI